MSDELSHGTNLPMPHAAAETAVAQGQRPASLASIIDRIGDAVEQETTGLRASGDFDLKASNARKSRYLYELTRAMKSIGEVDILREHQDGILRLREKLARNEAALRAHMSAVGEVATLLQDVIQRHEADGTYSAGEFGWAR